MKKLKKQTGESVAETLVAVLLMSLAFLMLVGAVITAARINARVENESYSFSANSATKVSPNPSITVKAYRRGYNTPLLENDYPVELYRDESKEYDYYLYPTA